MAPVHTIFPELKTSAVVLGSRILIMTAAKRYKTKKMTLFLPPVIVYSIKAYSALQSDQTSKKKDLILSATCD